SVLQRWADANSTPDFTVEVITEQRPGAANARNAGLTRVRTPWTMFFDSDDIMLPDHCASAIATATANPAAQIIGWDIRIHYPNGSSRVLKFAPNLSLYKAVALANFSTQMYMAHTELFRAVGGWREGTSMYDDRELGVRLFLQRPKMAKAQDTIQVEVYQQDNSISCTNKSLDACEPAFQAIEAVLPPRCRHWVDLQRLLMAVTWARNSPDAADHARAILARQPWLRRRLWTLFYHYSLRGGRGVARLYRPLSLLGI
ncbi:MAG: glycosyltransferase, partial [Muribaculaceae bacterium]